MYENIIFVVCIIYLYYPLLDKLKFTWNVV
jgi:hypothetical protein